jgi:hypothetical protein
MDSRSLRRRRLPSVAPAAQVQLRLSCLVARHTEGETRDGINQRARLNWLADVKLKTGLQRALFVTLSRKGGQRCCRDSCLAGRLQRSHLSYQ